MKLTHIGISQFRSIGTEPVMIDLTKRITVLVGQNDCGKSNVLSGIEQVSAIRTHDPKARSGGPVFQHIDFHMLDDAIQPSIRLRFSWCPNEHELSEFGPISLIARETVPKKVGKSVIEFESPELEALDEEHFLRFAAQCPGSAIDEIFGRTEHTVKQTRQTAMNLFNGNVSTIPRMLKIPNFRKIDDTREYARDGKGIIKLLAQWQHPEVRKDALQIKFDRVVKLLRELLNRPGATLEVPVSQKEIIVADAGMRLPLESHGTGVHQLIILAIAVLSEDNVMFGIEEPEIHLHPVLQRRFLQFLLNETSNRYLITTHSSALIAPSEEVDVIHLKMVDGVTIPTRVDTDANALAVLEDLGVRASDLLQANSVIWVEGPSDRIYLNRWLELMEPALREGLDYAIMFYGGRLLSHLSFEREDTEVNGFIKLLRINQRSAILMDSDRDDAADSINETKQRIQNECSSNHLHAWLTSGREIENYLTKKCVDAALVEHGAKEASISIEPFERFEASMQKACGKSFKPSWAYNDHKPAWAHRFVKHMTRDQITSDLETRLKELIVFIKPR